MRQLRLRKIIQTHPFQGLGLAPILPQCLASVGDNIFEYGAAQIDIEMPTSKPITSTLVGNDTLMCHNVSTYIMDVSDDVCEYVCMNVWMDWCMYSYMHPRRCVHVCTAYICILLRYWDSKIWIAKREASSAYATNQSKVPR